MASSKQPASRSLDPEIADTEAIARETHEPIETVERIYREELSTLAHEAKITQYLSVLASRRVRLMLRKNS